VIFKNNKGSRSMKTNNMREQQGFTLIELVVVIVILGILAVTAAPKFIDLQGDAEGATMQAIKASVETATTLTHSKALIAGATTGAGKISVNGGSDNVGVVGGWPENGATTSTTWTNLLDIDATDFLSAIDGTSGTAGRIVWYPTPNPVPDTALTATQVVTAACYVQYIESTDSNVKPGITVVTTGC